MFVIDTEKCTMCDECKDICPCDAIKEDKAAGGYVIDEDLCAECGACLDVCENGCISEVEIPSRRV